MKLLLVLFALIGGMAAALQSPMAGMIGQRLGMWESIFIIHLGGAAFALGPLLVQRGGQLASWSTLPWYALAAGAYGLVVVASITLCIPRLGAAATLATFVTGQLALALVMDHFGWFGVPQQPIAALRVAGLGLVLSGTWLMLYRA